MKYLNGTRQKIYINVSCLFKTDDILMKLYFCGTLQFLTYKMKLISIYDDPYINFFVIESRTIDQLMDFVTIQKNKILT